MPTHPIQQSPSNPTTLTATRHGSSSFVLNGPQRSKAPIAFLNPTSVRFEPKHIGSNSPTRNLNTNPERHPNAPEGQAVPVEHVSNTTANLPAALQPSPSRSNGGREASAPAASPVPAVSYHWTSRNNRKGRHALSITTTRKPRQSKTASPTQRPQQTSIQTPSPRHVSISTPTSTQAQTPAPDSASIPNASSKASMASAPAPPPPPSTLPPMPPTRLPRSTASLREVLRGVWRMFTCFPVWDVSWLVAVVFTGGSVIWCLNALFVYLPLVRPSTEFENEVLTAGGVTAFVGATVFELGSWLLVLEAINENRTTCFGWAVEEALDELVRDDEEGGWARLVPDKEKCTHHHFRRYGRDGKDESEKEAVGVSTELSEKHEDTEARSWRWYPSWDELRNHYFRELGFLASITQLIAATIFWISGFTALPGILNKLSPGLEDGIYWTPQVVGGSGFILSGALFMIETQSRWYKPAPKILGWHIGFWNLVGGIGFTLCPAFGYDTSSWAQYQATLSTFWGSWAFLIGSVLQWYESLSKYPVVIKKAK